MTSLLCLDVIKIKKKEEILNTSRQHYYVMRLKYLSKKERPIILGDKGMADNF